MTLDEAAAQGINRVRKPNWPPDVYANFTILDGVRGPWLYLFNRKQQEESGKETPEDMLIMALDRGTDWQQYLGEWDKNDKGL